MATAATTEAFATGIWVERLPLRPGRLGNPRRKPKGASSQTRSEAEGWRGRQAASLDNSNHLEISFAELAKLNETKGDAYRNKCQLQGLLLGSIEKIMQECEYQIQCLKDRETCPEMPREELEKQIKALLRHANRRSADYKRLSECQSQWISFRSKCCATWLAVPIGCNHRLCFFCNGARAEKYRERVRVMFDRLQNPVFLTLTVPSVKDISKRTFHGFRRAWNSFRKLHAGWISGGIMSIETTYNPYRSESPWHVHAHVLIDSAIKLPTCKCRPTGRGRERKHHPDCAFVNFKKNLEFDWFLLTGGRRDGWRATDREYWRRRREPEAWESEEARRQWNAKNTRVVDIRRVKDRKRAAFEVLKYITKAADFVSDPKAVDGFITATRGTRMLQTFGSWYGFEFPKQVNDWSHLVCNCGKNDFERQGMLFHEAVYMDEHTGRWHVKEKVCARGSPTFCVKGEIAS